MDCVRRPHLSKICAQSNPHPSENADFDGFRLIVPQPCELVRKNSISTNWKSTTRCPTRHRWTVYVTPKSPKGWLKTKLFTFGVALHFFVAGNRRHFKLNMWVEHSKSQPTDDKMCLKWPWPRHVTHFKLLVPLSVCFIYVLPFLVPFLIQCSRLMSHNKDLLTYLLT